MARPVSIQIKQLKELQKAMKAGETCIEPADVKPILANALMLIKDAALANLRSITKRAENLPAGWEHIEDALTVQEGKSDRIATAFCKVFRKKAPQGIWIEFGHRIVGHKPGKKDTGKVVPARPFFRAAIDVKRTLVRKTIRVGLQKLLEKAFGFGKPGDATD